MPNSIKSYNALDSTTCGSNFLAINSHDYPIIVVGSSPICILLCLALAKKNIYTCIVSPSDEWGGSWSTNSWGELKIETACHLLESSQLTHVFLRKLGIEMHPILGKAEPLIILRNSKGCYSSCKYHSRNIILKSLFVSFRRILRASVLLLPKIIFNSMNPGRKKIYFNHVPFRFPNHLCQLFRLEPLHIYSGGWSKFILDISSKALNNSFIQYKDTRLMKVTQHNGKTVAHLEDSTFQYCSRVVLSQSVSNVDLSSVIKTFTRKSLFLPKKIATKNYHILFEINFDSSIFHIELPQYIQVKNSNSIHRLSVVSSDENSKFTLLVQPKNNSSTSKFNLEQIKSDLSDILSWYINDNIAFFAKCKAPKVDLNYVLCLLDLKDIFCALSADFLSSKYIKPGDYGNITILKSIGCLSESIEALQGFIRKY